MKIKSIYKFLFILLAFVMMLQACGTSDGNVSTEQSSAETQEQIKDTSTETSGSFNETELVTETNAQTEASDTETESETETETETETEVITDVLVGETLEAEYAADFSVAKIFSNDMVVQRGEHIRVWGFAPESENGKKVSGSFKGMFAETIIENGEWCLTFGARLEADTKGAEMKIYTDKKETVFTGVLVGDVYLVMGQSNAAHNVNSHLAYTDPATQGGGKDAIDPDSIIRLNYVNGSGGAYKKKGSDYVYPDLENTKFWTRTTESDTLRFSAIGYYFARAMVEKTENKIPVGLIEVAVGGAPMGSFLPNDLAEKYDSDYYSTALGKYLTHRSSEHQGRYLYNCYLAPISRYAVAGAIWYQGESNNDQQYASVYRAEFSDFIGRLRSTHNVVRKNFPVFIVEFPTIYPQPSNYSGSSTWHYMEVGNIRAYMGLLPTTLKNSYIASSSDVWSDKTFPNNLHPNCKFEQAARLADLAEVVLLGKGSIDNASGPIYKSVTISEDKKTATITFINVGDGLTTADGGTAVKGIVGLINKDFVYTTIKPVSATITGKDKITVTFEEEIKAVAYNINTQDHYGDTLNLCNSAKIPAVAFISPYTERELNGFAANDFISDDHASVRKVGKAIDTLKADGEALFATGSVASQLAAAGNTVTIEEGTAIINCFGWVGFKYETLMFGYSIDGGDAVLNSAPATPGDAVLAAGGKFAHRFSVNVNVSSLTLGKHTVSVLALVEAKKTVVATLLTFDVIVTERTPTPEGIDLPDAADPTYGFIAASYDEIKADDTQLYFGNANVKLESAGNKITVQKGAKTISWMGWIGFEATLDKFGYAIDGNTPVMESEAINPEPAVIDIAGQNAKRFINVIDISSLDVGEHAVDVLVRINTADGTALLKMHSFILVIK